MLNIVIPLNVSIDKYRHLLDAVAGSNEINVLLGVKHEQYAAVLNEYGHLENFNFFEFDNPTSQEQMINSMQEYIVEGPILILRKPVTLKEYNKFVNSDRDIVTSKKVRSKFKSFVFNLWQKLTKLIFGVKMYAGDYSTIFFNSDIANVVLSTGNLSYSSRVNRWKGIRQGVVTTEAKEEKHKMDKTSALKYILAVVGLITVGVAVTTVVSLFVDMTIMIGLFLFGLVGICVAVSLILIAMLIFNTLVGKKQYGQAIVMDKRVKSEGVK
ncbi:MAG: hypothetical protein IJY90_01485 [Clostridia bacterium]|nr:hypothetical protein [Clostridia bacterium]